MEFSDRIERRAAKHPNKAKMLDIVRRPAVQRAMLQLVIDGKKPVTALSGPLVEELGLEAARDHGLRKLAGEATAHVMENVHGCVRKAGNKIVTGDAVFESGQGFRVAPAAAGGGGGGEPATVIGLLLSMIDDDKLESLREAVAIEVGRRFAA